MTGFLQDLRYSVRNLRNSPGFVIAGVPVIGMGFGVVASAAASTVLSSLLFGVSPMDPLVFVSVSLFLAAVALPASHSPARRAVRINPMTALRSE